MTAGSDTSRRDANLLQDAVRRLGEWTAPDAGQERLRTAYLDHLDRHPEAIAKGSPADGGVREHLTASCLVITPDARHVLLTHHRRAQQWFQFGGHLEASDATLHAAAAREGREESGIDDITPHPSIVQLDRHELRGDFTWCREHLDVRFVATLDREARPTVSAESLDVAWWPADALPDGTRTELTALVRAARERLGI